MKLTHLEQGKIGLIQQTEDGRIIQIGLTSEQSNQLQMFLGYLSQECPLIQFEKYELILKEDKENNQCEEKTKKQGN